MKIFMTGATGFIGRSLAQRLVGEGHQVVAWARSPERARDALGADIEIVQATADDRELETAIDGCDAVVGLAGEPLFPKRWSEARRKALVDSRVGLTKRISAAIGRVENRPKVFVSGSAVGIYGNAGDTVLDESSPNGDGFLAQLCIDWEDAAIEAREFGARVALIRTGVVLGKEGGALAQMRAPFAMGVGGRIGSGKQYMPWIHLADIVELFRNAIVDERYDGPINGAAPEEATNLQFTKAFGRVLNRPTIFPVPGAALAVMFGEASDVLLGSQRVRPKAALDLGYEFRFANVENALRDIVDNDGDVEMSVSKDEHGRYLLEQRTFLDRPLDEVFSFFSKAENLGAITPPTMTFSIKTQLPIEMSEDLEIDYDIELGPVPMRWRSRIEAWEPNRRFVDSQIRGPYARWWHEHRFEATENGTAMVDRVYYSPPLGPIGWIANKLFIAPMLRRIFGYRHQLVSMRFA